MSHDCWREPNFTKQKEESCLDIFVSHLTWNFNIDNRSCVQVALRRMTYMYNWLLPYLSKFRRVTSPLSRNFFDWKNQYIKVNEAEGLFKSSHSFCLINKLNFSIGIHNRTAFNWVSKVIRQFLWFWFWLYYSLRSLMGKLVLVLVLRHSIENRSNYLM